MRTPAGDALLRYRLDNGISPHVAAERLGMTLPWYLDIEHCDRPGAEAALERLKGGGVERVEGPMEREQGGLFE